MKTTLMCAANELEARLGQRKFLTSAPLTCVQTTFRVLFGCWET